MAKKVKIGPYSAYALAKKYGYQGTEEEWVNEQEQNRIASEEAATRAETAASEAETNKQSSGDNKIAAQNAAAQAQLAKEGAESAKTESEHNKSETERLAQEANTYAQNAEAAKNAALQSETAAEQSAVAAEAAKNAALQSETAAEQSAVAAEAAKNAALQSETAAEQSAVAAEAAKNAALDAKQEVENNKNIVIENTTKVEGFAQTAESAATKAEEAQVDLESAILEIGTQKDQALTEIENLKNSITEEINQVGAATVEDVTTVGNQYKSDMENIKTTAVQEITMSKEQSVSEVENKKNKAITEIGSSKTTALSEISAKEQQTVDNLTATGDAQVARIEESGDFYSKSESDEKFAPIKSALTVKEAGNDMVLLSPTVEAKFVNLKIYGKSTQDGTPSSENPVPVVSAGKGGSITLSITDGAEQNQSLPLSTPSGLSGIKVESGGNYTDSTGQQLASDYWDFGDGQKHILCGEIASYNGEEITTPYISSTGALTTGAQVLYVLPAPRTEPIPAETMAAYRALTTYDGTTIINSQDSLAQIEAESIANGSKLIEEKYEETSQKTIDAVFSGIVKENNIDEMFNKWISAVDTRNEDLGSLLDRWFSLLEDDYTYGVKFYKFGTSQVPDGTFIDDSAKLGPCTPGTNVTQSVDPYSKRPAFWTREVAYEIENKEVAIKAIVGVRGVTRVDLLSGKYGMVGVAQKTGWVWDSSDENYYYHRYKVSLKDTDANYVPLPEAVRPDGPIRSFIVHAKYMAGRKDEKLTSASGLAPVNFISMQSQATEWRKRGADYCGINGCDIAFRMRMFWLKYGKKGNSGTLEGCSSYNYQKKAVVSESGVSRVVLSASDASEYLIGSTVSVGKANGDNIDRGNASMRELADLVKIKSIEDVTIDDTQYKAIVLDTTSTFDTEAGITYISTMPWHSGSCDNVLGLDGSPTNCTNGKEPFIIQGLESQLGGYAIAADQLTEQILTETEYTHNLVCFREAADISTSITDNAIRSDVKLIMPTDQQSTWLYQGDVEIDKDGNMYPITVGASSTTGMRAAVGVPPAGSRVHAWWVWANLYYGSRCGLSCGYAFIGAGGANWDGLAGACGSGANRGEYKA